MIREEEINNAKEAFYERIFQENCYYDPRDCFEEGAKWADANPKNTWISVEDDLPCNHEELIDKNFKGNFQKTLFVIALLDDQCEDLTCMINDDGRWKWIAKGSYTHWMPMPKLPNE